MRAFADVLNDNLLISDITAAQALRDARKPLLEGGAGLEGDLGGDPEPVIMAVYSRPITEA